MTARYVPPRVRLAKDYITVSGYIVTAGVYWTTSYGPNYHRADMVPVRAVTCGDPNWEALRPASTRRGIAISVPLAMVEPA